MIGTKNNGKRHSGTKFTSPGFCLPFTQTVNQPVCPCKWDSPSFGTNLLPILMEIMDAFHSTKTFEKYGNSGKMVQKFPEKVQEIPRTVEFPKREAFNQKFEKFQEQSRMEGKHPGKLFRKLGYTSRGCPLFGNFGKCYSIRYWKLLKIQSGRFG